MDLRYVRRWRLSLVQYSVLPQWYDSSILSVYTLYFASQAFFFSFLLDCLLLHITNFTSVALLWCLENGIWKNILLLEKEHCFWGITDCIITAPSLAVLIDLAVGELLIFAMAFGGGSAFTYILLLTGLSRLFETVWIDVQLHLGIGRLENIIIRLDDVSHVLDGDILAESFLF